MTRKRLVILGSTGSIGRNALEVVAAHPERFRVVALAAKANVERMTEQALRFQPEVVAMADADAAKKLLERLNGRNIRVLEGMEGIIEAATFPSADLMLSGISGGIGLLPTLEAVRRGRNIAFVNKEVLVIAGELVIEAACQSGAQILPVDSEISAIFQCLQGCPDRTQVSALYLTASGGPFRTTPKEEFPFITPERALKHPNWKMGAKVTVDAATLMNKGFEVIEAKWLFGLRLEQIRVVVHPQSVVHSYVEFVDGSLLAQLGVPDMKIPIQYAMTYPDRLPTPSERLRLTQLRTLTFEEPDVERFPCLSLAYEAARLGGTMPAVLSGADEVAVQAFLDRRLPFDQIPNVVAETMKRHTPKNRPSLEELLAAERWARETAQRLVEKNANDIRISYV